MSLGAGAWEHVSKHPHASAPSQVLRLRILTSPKSVVVASCGASFKSISKETINVIFPRINLCYITITESDGFSCFYYISLQARYQFKPSQTSIFKYKNVSIRELDLRNINYLSPTSVVVRDPKHTYNIFIWI